MSRRSSAEGGEGSEAGEMLRLSVRKDLFEEPDETLLNEVSPTGVKLETDFEASIDNIALERVEPKRRKRSLRAQNNVKSKSKRKKKHKSSAESSEESDGDGNKSLAASVLPPVLPNCSVRLARTGGKPYSHELSMKHSSSSKKKAAAIQPLSGKPRSMMTICKKKSKKNHSKPSEATYQSQIIDSGNLKIKITNKKAALVNQDAKPPPPPVSNSKPSKKKPRATKSSSRKRKALSSNPPSVSSGEEYEPRDVNAGTSVATVKPNCKVKRSGSKAKEKRTRNPRCKSAKEIEVAPQCGWGGTLPETVLNRIFQYVVATDGTLPSIVSFGKVCKLWYRASADTSLWKNIDLAQHTKDKFKTDYILAWLLANRLKRAESLNIAQWNSDNMPYMTASIVELAPDLRDLNLSGWDRITPEMLHDLVVGLKHLNKIDLSQMSESCTCLSACSLAKMSSAMGDRLTHLIISNNHFTALTQIFTSLATNCPNLEVLDVSGAKATSHPAVLPLDVLQKGCPKLRVLRAANAQLVIPVASNQPEGPGFPELEELSAAAEWGGNLPISVGDYRLEDEGLARILKGATKLKLLDLRGCRVSGSGLVRVPAWDLEHLFLSGCNITRQRESCLELICEKWAHSLIEVDFSWATATEPLDAAIEALADKAADSQLRILNLCGSSVSFEPLQRLLLKCPRLESVNLSSCRALPRGIKRHYTDKELRKLIQSLDPTRKKVEDDEVEEKPSKKSKKKIQKDDQPTTTQPKVENEVPDKKIEDSPTVSESPNSQTTPETPKTEDSTQTTYASPDSVQDPVKENSWTLNNFRGNLPKPVTGSSPKLNPPVSQTTTETSNWALGNYSPITRMDQTVQSPYSSQTSPLARADVQKSPYSSQRSPIAPLIQQPKSPYSPLARPEGPTQYNTHVASLARPEATQKSPYTNNPSPMARPDMSQPVSPYSSHLSPRQIPQPQHSPYPTHPSPYSTQPSPYSSQRSPYSSQKSPYSSQHSPFSTQPSPYSQHSPYSAQPSPDTSQMVKMDVQKQWNVGGYSPAAVKPHLSHNTAQASPDQGPGASYNSPIINETPSPRHISQYTNNYQGMTNLSPNILNVRHEAVVKNVLDSMSPDTSNNMLRLVEQQLKDARHSIYPESSSVE